MATPDELARDAGEDQTPDVVAHSAMNSPAPKAENTEITGDDSKPELVCGIYDPK